MNPPPTLSSQHCHAFATVHFAIILCHQSPPLSIDGSCPSRSLLLSQYLTSQPMQDLPQDCCISIMSAGIKFDTMQMLSAFHSIITHICMLSAIALEEDNSQFLCLMGLTSNLIFLLSFTTSSSTICITFSMAFIRQYQGFC